MRFGFFLGIAIAASAFATTIPSLSFAELTDRSELIVSGQINRSWTDWDPEHKYIWTHYELAVSSVLKGNPSSTVTLSEPGGTIGLQSMSIPGAVAYGAGSTVLVFLQRMPNGYLRTTGWSQGKFTLDAAGRIHAEGRAAESTLRSLDGMSVAQLRELVTSRVKGGAR
jgi:hypothetical protein